MRFQKAVDPFRATGAKSSDNNQIRWSGLLMGKKAVLGGCTVSTGSWGFGAYRLLHSIMRCCIALCGSSMIIVS